MDTPRRYGIDHILDSAWAVGLVLTTSQVVEHFDASEGFIARQIPNKAGQFLVRFRLNNGKKLSAIAMSWQLPSRFTMALGCGPTLLAVWLGAPPVKDVGGALSP